MAVRVKPDDWLTEDKLLIVQDWARSGLPKKDIAHNIGISPASLDRWEKKYPPFAEALKKGEVADVIVENSLYKRACGYDYDEETVTTDGDGNVISSKCVRKHVPPDTTAAIFWLKNRRPKRWRNSSSLTISAEEQTSMALEKIEEALKSP